MSTHNIYFHREIKYHLSVCFGWGAGVAVEGGGWAEINALPGANT